MFAKGDLIEQLPRSSNYYPTLVVLNVIKKEMEHTWWLGMEPDEECVGKSHYSDELEAFELITNIFSDGS